MLKTYDLPLSLIVDAVYYIHDFLDFTRLISRSIIDAETAKVSTTRGTQAVFRSSAVSYFTVRNGCVY